MIVGILLRHLVRRGTLRVIDATGRAHVYSGAPGPTVTIRLHDRAIERQLLFNPRLMLGEAYMNGRLTIEDDASLYDLLDFLGANINLAPKNVLTPLYNGLGRAFRGLQQWNPVGRARRNVAHHYDLSDALYDIFLDRDRQYSCAYFTAP
ncbi:MAG: class I SAM-dependent methyltransferase, partial [Stellaceae bacterium]